MSGPKTRSEKGEEGDFEQTAMGKPDKPVTPLNTKDLTVADLLAEFKKNQEGNTRIENKLADIEKRSIDNAADIKKHIQVYEDEIEELKGKHDSIDKRMTEIEDAFDAMSLQCKEMKEENLLLRKRVFLLEKSTKVCTDREEEMKRQNIIIQGIQESAYKKTKADVTSLLSHLGVDVNNQTVTSIYRVGPKPKNQAHSRPIKVKFASSLSKQEMFKNIKKLKDSEKWANIGISDDLTQDRLSKQRDLRALAGLARTKGLTAQQRGDTLIIDEQRYSYKDLDSLPEGISLEQAKLKPTKDGLAFQGPHVYLSNLADAPFVDDDGTQYRSNEQYFQ